MAELSVNQSRFKHYLKNLLLDEGSLITFEDLENKAHQLGPHLYADISPEEIDVVIAELTNELTVTLSPSGTVIDPATFIPWLEERKQTTKTPRWNAYQELLISRDWESTVVKELAKQSDEIVELLGDPTVPGPWSRKGLLMGDVQSGKTANYIGVLNKALDYGYRLLIVIGGHTNELRRQTQERFDSDLLGIDTEYIDDNIAHEVIPRIGIGRIDSELSADALTTVRKDFSASTTTAGVKWITKNQPTVLIIKKNAKLISNVANYIRLRATEAGVLDIPMIVIDDEADWGTPNTGTDTDPTKVNEEIRNLLATSTRSSYLGITATPFANIFIDHEVSTEKHGDDLFPTDFIRVLPAPSSYFGISSYFSPTDSAIRTSVNDCLEIVPIIHRSSHYIESIPESLKAAVCCFVIGTAIRRLRKNKTKSASMLINISRFNDVQKQIHQLTSDYLSQLQAVIKTEFQRKSQKQSRVAEFIYKVWEEEFEEDSEFNWDQIKKTIFQINSEFRTLLVNSKTAVQLRRERKLLTAEQRKSLDLLPTIYVGGDVLSRGLTLDGLQVSYFVREPRTMDTLMQMGRWFGYRPGYSDLIRIWLPEDTAEDFSWSAGVTQELRELLLEMRSRELTPRQFGLRVRTHPEGFKVVAANKSKATSNWTSGPILWQDCLKESFLLSNDEKVKADNLNAFDTLVKELGRKSNVDIFKGESESGYPLWQGVPLEMVQQFLLSFKGHPSSLEFGKTSSSSSLMSEAVSEAKGSDLWDIAIVTGNGGTITLPCGFKFGASIRNNISLEPEKLIKIQNRKVATGDNLANSFSSNEKKGFEKFLTTSIYGQKPSKQPGALAFIQRPRLLLYGLVAPDGTVKDATVTSPYIAVAIAFPKLDVEEAIRLAEKAKKYQVNTVWQNIYKAQFESDDLVEEED